MHKQLSAALVLILTSAAVAAVTTQPDHLWEAQQKLKDAQAQIDGLQAQVAQLQSQVSTLQTENGDLKAKLAQKEEQLRSAATQPIKLTPEAINPPDLLKDYPQDKMPVYMDPTNSLRIRVLNDYLAQKNVGIPVIITGKFLSTSGSNTRGFTILMTSPDMSLPLRWTVTASLPSSATDDVVHLKRDDTVTVTGTISRVSYATSAKYNTLVIMLKDASLGK